MNRACLAIWVCLAGFSGAGCAGEQSAGEAAGVVRDSAGIRIVDLSGAPSPSMRALEVDGAWLKEFNLEVGQLADVVPLPGGGAVLLDELSGTISVLDRAGQRLLEFGRLGEGPGEFSPHGGVSWVLVTDSSLVIPDNQLQRMTEFSLEGEVLKIDPMPGSGADGGLVIGVDWRAHPDGGIVFRALSSTGDRILWSHEGVVETLHAFEVPDPTSSDLLPPVALWDVGVTAELVLGRSDRGRIEKRIPGDVSPLWVARWEDERAELTARDRAHLEELLLTSSEAGWTGSLPAEERDRILRSVALPDSVPVIASVLADRMGRTWIQGATPVTEMGLDALSTWSATGFGGTEWRVLGPDGFLEEVVTLPRGFTPRRFWEDCIVGVLADELGVQRPARVCVR